MRVLAMTTNHPDDITRAGREHGGTGMSEHLGEQAAEVERLRVSVSSMFHEIELVRHERETARFERDEARAVLGAVAALVGRAHYTRDMTSADGTVLYVNAADLRAVLAPVSSAVAKHEQEVRADEVVQVRMLHRSPNHAKGQIGTLHAASPTGHMNLHTALKWVDYGEPIQWSHGQSESTGEWCGPSEYEIVARTDALTEGQS
jgi:hypothetical protein